MSQRKKGKSSATGTPVNTATPASAAAVPSLQLSRAPSYLDRNRDEICSLEAIFDTDFKLIENDPNRPIHFQIVVKPAPNEADCNNHCTVTLDVMLTASPSPLLVVRKLKALGDVQVEALQKAANEEADRLVAKGEEAIIYSVVTFMQEWLLPYNKPAKSFHEQMVEREKREKEQAALEHEEQQNASRVAEKEEKELLKKSIEAANKKKAEALVRKQEELAKGGGGSNKPPMLNTLGSGATGGSLTPSSRSISASPAASPSVMSSTPPHLPNFSLGSSALSSHSVMTKSKTGSSASSSSSSSKNAQLLNQTIPNKNIKTAQMKIPEKTSETPLTKSGGKGDKGKHREERISTSIQSKLAAKASEKAKSGRHKPRELKEHSEHGLGRNRSESDDSEDSCDGSDGSEDEDEDDEHEDESEEEDQQASQSRSRNLSEDEESLFGTPGTSFDRKKGQAPLSDIDKLMAQLAIQDSKTEKQRLAAEAKRSKLRLSANSDSDEAHNSDSDEASFHHESDSDEDDEDEDDESFDGSDDDEDLTASPKVGPTVQRSWLESGTGTTNSDSTPHSSQSTTAPTPSSLPYYSRFNADFDQMEMIGKGGGGEVYKVRNKVDKLYYAIKRIKLKRKNPAMNKKIIKEVSMIAMLHHKYIVRYYQAWIEGEETPTTPHAGTSTASKKPSLPRKSTTTTSAKDFNLADDDEDWLSPSNPSTMGHTRGGDSDDDEDEDEDSDDEDSVTEGRHVSTGQQYLYIQMEFCPNNTLREIIDKRIFETSPDECWRVFRQILEAVSYIHAKGILHRDLKPGNIFFSSSSGPNASPENLIIKLGDFGLAKLQSPPQQSIPEGSGANGNDITQIPASQRSVSDLEAHAISRQDSVHEAGVGTHFYAAPEQARGAASYDHRVDMYSVGIIFFEMLYPFNSLMERALQLEELRTTGKVPNEFLVGRADRLNIIRIIESLLMHNPEERPTAQELLKSGLIPLKIEDEYMELALKSVSQRDSVHHTRLLDILFSMPPDQHIDFTFDYLSVSSRADSQLTPAPTTGGSSSLLNALTSFREAPLHFHQLIQMKIFDILANIFRNHGAIYLSTPIITPKSNIGMTKTNTALYLDPQGNIIKLPYTLTVPFARYIAQQSGWTWSGAANISAHAALDSSGDLSDFTSDGSTDSDYHFDLRRYDISKVYRKNIIGGRPKELYECDFDIVWSNPFANTSAGSSTLPHSTSSASLSSMKDQRAMAREKLCALSAEVVKLTYEVLQEFVPAIGTSFCIRVNHADLFDAVLDVVLTDLNSLSKAAASGGKKGEDAASIRAISSAALKAQRESQAGLRRELCKLASSYALFSGSWSKSPMRRQLLKEKKLPLKKIELLGALFSLKSEPNKPEGIFQKIRDTLFSVPESRYVLKESTVIEQLEFIQHVFEYLKLHNSADSNHHIVFDISICGKHELYSGGIIFQAFVPNTNMDMGNAAALNNNAAEDAINMREYHSATASSSSSNAFANNGKGEAITQNAFETVALGGQYDALIASFMPPTASVPLSAVGVNFAIEKIVNAVVAFQMKSPSRSMFINPVLARRLKKSSHLSAMTNDTNANNILLFCSKNALIKDRAKLANELWNDNLPCLYLHPSHLNQSNLKLYAKEYMIRWVVNFKKNDFKQKGHVSVIDLLQPRSDSVKSAKDLEIAMPLSEVSSYIRGKLSGKRGEAEESLVSHAIGAHKSSHASHPYSHAHHNHGRDFDLKIIDGHNGKSQQGTMKTLLAHVKRTLNSVLSGGTSTFAVFAVDLPFTTIRSIATAFYSGPQAIQTVIEESPSKQRVICDQLVSAMSRKLVVVHMEAHPTPSSKSKEKDKEKEKEKALAEAHSKVDVLYIYSIPDRRADMVLSSSS